MKLDITVDQKSLNRVRDAIGKLSGGQLKKATADAMNDTAFKVRGAMVSHLTNAFDRPTPYVTRSPKFVPATAENLSVTILPTLDARNRASKGGKVGIDQQKILAAQARGGARSDKRSERALRRVGILPAGYQIAIPAKPIPGTDDGRGNLRGAFLARMISYFQASGEVGYRANMRKATKKKLADKTTYSSIATRKTYSLTRGVEYFVSYGKLRGNGTNHLQAGIWQRTGTHGSSIRPAVIFTRSGSYRPRLDMDRVSRDADAQQYFNRRLRFRIRQAAGQ